jgi:HSP20 family molecular chaperone IbpA/ribosomal protein L40E
MFSKKTCQRCGRKTSKDNSFCPKCGYPFGKKSKKEEFGMLGEDDSFNELNSQSNSLFGNMGMGGLSGGFMNKMISHTMKMLEKEMEREMKEGVKKQNINPNQNNFPNTKIRLMINGKEINLNKGMEGNENIEKKEKQKASFQKLKKFSEEQAKKFSKLPKKEPKTDLKRIADKISYEIEIPGVESIEDVSITPLESSIEIKAISKEKAYSKLIPLNLPITGYGFSEGLLVLEFKGN